MQFKRDTEFALRILYCIAETQGRRNSLPVCVPAGDIVAQTGIPRRIVERICGYLETRQIIRKEQNEAGELCICVGTDFFNQSILRILEATEAGCRLLAVFDRRTEFYQACETALEAMQERVTAELAQMTLGDLLPGPA